MNPLTEGKHAGSCVLSLANDNRSIDNMTVASGNVIGANQVVGKLTSGGKLVPYDNGASDGSQAAVGISLNHVDATDADQVAAIIVRDAEVIRDELVFMSGTSGGDMTAAYADLVALGIIVRGPEGGPGTA